MHGMRHEIKASRILATIVVILTLLSLAVILLLPIHFLLRFSFLMLLMFYAQMFYQKFLVKKNKSFITAIQILSNGECLIEKGGGSFLVKILGDSLVTRAGMVLRLKRLNHVEPLLILTDSIKDNQFHALFTQLRIFHKNNI